MITNVSQAAQRLWSLTARVSHDEAAGDQQNMLVFPRNPLRDATAGHRRAAAAAGIVLVALAGLGLGTIGMAVHTTAREKRHEGTTAVAGAAAGSAGAGPASRPGRPRRL